MLKFLELFRKSPIKGRISRDTSLAARKYGFFTSLLAGNNQALELLTDLERTIYEDRPFTLDEFTQGCENLIGTVYDIVEDLNALSGGKWPQLFEAAEQLGVRVLRDLVRRRTVEKSDWTLPLVQVSLAQLDQVGGKAANLGEVSNRVGLPTPLGFAVTAWACHSFLAATGIRSYAASATRGLDVSDTERLQEVCGRIQRRIMDCALPPELEADLRAQASGLAHLLGGSPLFAVRSSATCEDSESSFAGQHATVLGVRAEDVPQAYKEVVASTFSPRALFYRRSKGYSDDDVLMSVLCLTMVDALASGVLYTVDPGSQCGDDLLVSAAWGLGVTVVDGSGATDFYRVERAGRRVSERVVADKKTKLRLAQGEGQEGFIPVEVDPERRTRPCLSEDQLRTLVDWGLKLEEHYGAPQDIEWAMDREMRLFILQARPLGRSRPEPPEVRRGRSDPLPHRPVLLRGGQSASPGTCCGLAWLALSDHTLHHIPQGAILVARQTSPTYVAAMGRVAGIITDVGSVTGHMASVAREFAVPTLVGTATATTTIAHGDEITLDATGLTVYRGCVTELLGEKRPVNLMKGSPVYKAAQEALKRLSPLNLTDPRAENFSPQGCRSIHDIIRFAHEMAMQEMFRISDDFDEDETLAVSLRTYLPMRVYVVDLGGGLAVLPSASTAEIADVKCVPLQALLRGMTHEGVRWHGSVGFNLSGFTSILAESVLRDPEQEGRMGGPNYAVVSGEYLNFNGRLGYHFATVDSYCGPVINDNYVTFSFKGGAADIGRRTRRAGLIAAILKRLDFKVTMRGDFVRGELKKYDCERILEKLDWLGRLLGSVRLLDMMLTDDSQVAWYAEEFLKGNYVFAREAAR